MNNGEQQEIIETIIRIKDEWFIGAYKFLVDDILNIDTYFFNLSWLVILLHLSK